jgi:hypothetical protein
MFNQKCKKPGFLSKNGNASLIRILAFETSVGQSQVELSQTSGFIYVVKSAQAPTSHCGFFFLWGLCMLVERHLLFSSDLTLLSADLHVWCSKLVWQQYAQVLLGAVPPQSSGLKSLWRLPNRA